MANIDEVIAQDDWTTETGENMPESVEADVNDAFLVAMQAVESEVLESTDVAPELVEDEPSELADALAMSVEEVVATPDNASADEKQLVIFEDKVDSEQEKVIAVDAEIIQYDEAEETEEKRGPLTEHEFERFINTPFGKQLLVLLQQYQQNQNPAQPVTEIVKSAEAKSAVVDTAKVKEEVNNAEDEANQLLSLLAEMVNKNEADQTSAMSNPNTRQQQTAQGGAVEQVSQPGISLGQSLANFVGGLAQLGSKAINTLGNEMKKAAAESQIQAEATNDSLNDSKSIERDNNVNIAAGMASININEAQSSIPSNLLFRMENLKNAEANYIGGLEAMWQSEQMQKVRQQIKEYAAKEGIPDADVIAGINSTGSGMEDISNAFNQAFENNPQARAAKTRMDEALLDWKANHEYLTDDFGYLDAGNKHFKKAFDEYERSQGSMESATAEVPKTSGEDKSHYQQLMEFLERMREHIKEIVTKITDCVRSLFGRGTQNDSPAPAP